MELALGQTVDGRRLISPAFCESKSPWKEEKPHLELSSVTHFSLSPFRLKTIWNRPSLVRGLLLYYVSKQKETMFPELDRGNNFFVEHLL